MNAICAQLIDLAKRQLGYKEGPKSNQTKYSNYFDVAVWQWFGSKAQFCEWCSIFVCWLFCQNEILGPEQARTFLGCPKPKENYAKAVPYLFTYLTNKGYKLSDKTKGQPGDIIVLNSKKHVGIIEKIENGKYVTIEGNKGNYVAHGNYKLNSTTITAIFHPDWDKAHFFEQKEKPADPVHIPEPVAPVQPSTLTVNTKVDPLRLRVQPNTSCPTICLMKKGSKVTLISYVNNEWAKVKYKTMTGYAYRKYLK